MAGQIDKESLTLDELETALAQDTKVKLAGIDVDGMHTPVRPLCTC
jgi:hypothetical protein